MLDLAVDVAHMSAKMASRVCLAGKCTHLKRVVEARTHLQDRSKLSTTENTTFDWLSYLNFFEKQQDCKARLVVDFYKSFTAIES